MLPCEPFRRLSRNCLVPRRSYEIHHSCTVTDHTVCRTLPPPTSPTMSASSASPGSMATAATVLSVPRLTTLFSSLIVALGSGTNYVRVLSTEIQSLTFIHVFPGVFRYVEELRSHKDRNHLDSYSPTSFIHSRNLNHMVTIFVLQLTPLSSVYVLEYRIRN